MHYFDQNNVLIDILCASFLGITHDEHSLPVSIRVKHISGKPTWWTAFAGHAGPLVKSTMWVTDLMHFAVHLAKSANRRIIEIEFARTSII